MSDRVTSSLSQPEAQPFLSRIHQPTKHYLPQHLSVPAHIHHIAHRMANPPTERPQSRKEFLALLRCFDITDADVQEKFGYGTKTVANGDRMVVVWEAHTEYYSYQVWHLPQDRRVKLSFGPLTIPDYAFPLSPLGLKVNALDLLVLPGATVAPEELRVLLPGPHLYGSRVFGHDLAVATSYTPDEFQRERYLVTSPDGNLLLQHLGKLIETIVAIENYYHLVMLPFQAFSHAVDQIHDFEQRHLYQRAVLIDQLSKSKPDTLQKWLTVLTQDLLHVSRLAESMRYRLSASVPYEKIVQGNVVALQERSLEPLRPLSEYIYWKITGVTDGYQQLLKRIDAMEKDFEATVAVLRTQIELRLQEQNVALQDHNLKLLASVDSTTRAQAILQRTVESLSLIVITYYLSGLGGYIFKALHEIGLLANSTIATALFVPIAFGVSYVLMTVGRKLIHKRMANTSGKADPPAATS